MDMIMIIFSCLFCVTECSFTHRGRTGHVAQGNLAFARGSGPLEVHWEGCNSVAQLHCAAILVHRQSL